MAEPTRILLVDDDPDFSQLTEMELTKRGYPLSVCSDSTRALDVLRETPYDCVLLDLRMAGLEGTELLPIIKHNFQTLPVIIISAYCGSLDVSHYISLGAFQVVTKAFTSEQLIEVINRAVGKTVAIQFLITSLSLTQARDQFYRKLLVTALQKANWNQLKAAELLGVSRNSMRRWLHKYKIKY